MTYGPLEFAVWLRRKDQRESAKVKAARAAVVVPRPPENRLTIVSGSARLHPRITADEMATTASGATAPDVR